MAFKDIVRVMYNGEIQLEYKDASHRYNARPRVNWDLPADNPKAWGKTLYPKGTTTLLGDTLEKKGLQTWPLGVGFTELFGFYNFTGDNGEKMIGFSKDVNGKLKGTLWGKTISEKQAEELMPIILSAHTGWTRKQKEGADIGSVVHDAIDHFINGKKFNIANEYMDKFFEENAELDRSAKDIEEHEFVIKAREEIKMASQAFARFVQWWSTESPEAISTEDIIYSKQYNVSGTYDALLNFKGKRVLADFKTSKASKNAGAPDGIYYSYFIQSAIYAMILEEMGEKPVDDLLIVSCRKDGGFAAIFASDLGITVKQAKAWAKAVIVCYQYMDFTKKALIEYNKSQADPQTTD